MIDAGVNKSVSEFNNTGEGINQVIIKTTGMKLNVKEITGTIVYYYKSNFVSLSPTIKRKSDNIFEATFQITSDVSGMASLTLIFS